MQEESGSALGLALSKRQANEQAEVLEWMGSAYGRSKGSAPIPEAVRFALPRLLNLPRLAKAGAELAKHKRRAIGALVMLLAMVSAIALMRAWGFPSPNSVVEIPKTPQRGVVRETEPTRDTVSEDRAARADIERTLHEAKAQLASEHETRVALEEKVAGLTSTLATQTLARESAERSDAETRAQLEAERKARAERENTTNSANETLAHARVANSAMPVPVVVPAPDPAVPDPDRTEPADVPPQVTKVDAKSADAARHQEKAEPAGTGGGASSDAAKSALLKGEELFAKGDILAARQHFGKAAAMGMAEGALALGNTYDSVSLAKAGLKLTGDPERARQWYRRAHELAQRQR